MVGNIFGFCIGTLWPAQTINFRVKTVAAKPNSWVKCMLLDVWVGRAFPPRARKFKSVCGHYMSFFCSPSSLVYWLRVILIIHCGHS